ncbi:MAG TPA: hypothetical protein VJH92_05590 [Candidatus Nanoarchaeia archaeon]|nr:hypothetical protein [Candidatus Nanoarchaeia archaeon]
MSFFNKSKAQVGIEYLMVVGFVTLAVISVISLALFYSAQIKDRIRLNQIENFATQLVNSAESVFFAGEPSKSTIRLYIPDGVKSIEINSDHVFVTTIIGNGINTRVYESKVPLNGSIGNVAEGIRKITLEAKQDFVDIRVSN